MYPRKIHMLKRNPQESWALGRGLGGSALVNVIIALTKRLKNSPFPSLTSEDIRSKKLKKSPHWTMLML